MFTFGLAMIVKNADDTIKRLLDRIHQVKVFDQIVLIDTGSTDNTAEIVLGHPISNTEGFLYTKSQEGWHDHFADARNESFRFLCTDTACWLDADDLPSASTLKAWRRLAAKLMQQSYVGISIPYYYQVNTDGSPRILQYRERIFKYPNRWEWREPIHEVCCYKEEGGTTRTVKKYPNLHFPGKRTDPERNWRILHKHLESGESLSARNLWYIQRAAYDKGDYYYALMVSNQIKALEPSGFISYEYLKTWGDALFKLARKDPDDCALGRDAERKYREALRLAPWNNAIRENLIELLMYQEDGLEAINETRRLSVEVPEQGSSHVIEVYQPEYVYALKAHTMLRVHGLHWEVIELFLKATDSEKPARLAADLYRSILRTVEETKAIVIGYHEDWRVEAFDLEELLRHETGRPVYAVQDPRSVMIAGEMFIYIGPEEGLYVEDAPPHTTKYWLCSSAIEPKFGWNIVPYLPGCDLMGVENVLNVLFKKVCGRIVTSIEEALLFVKETDYEEYRFSLDTDIRIGVTPCTHTKVNLYTGAQGQGFYSISGKRKDILALYVDEEGALCFESRKQVNIVKLLADDGPLKFKFVKRCLGRIGFYASGIEEWDGTTPYRYGIGGSESSVVYLAEEMARSGYAVDVYCPTPDVKTVSGVKYVPRHKLTDNSRYDLFIVSRDMDVATRAKYGRTQLFWAHDIVANYRVQGFQDRLHNIDRFICVSDWQRGQAIDAYTFLSGRCDVIPNGVKQLTEFATSKLSTDSRKDSLLWISQPERGLEDVLAWRMEGLINWPINVLYGFYNILTTDKTPERFQWAMRLKYLLRQHGGIIYGRLGYRAKHLLMQETKALAYPSDFPETFCISVLEAHYNGVRIVAQRNGATGETLGKLPQIDRDNVTLFDSVNYSKLKRKCWVRSTTEVKPISKMSLALRETDETFSWRRIAQIWINYLKKPQQ